MDWIKLIAMIAVVVAVYTGGRMAWTGFKDNIGRPYAEAQRAADAPLLKRANDNAAAADRERDNAQADTKACVASTAKQSDGIREWKARADLAEKRARDAEKGARLTTEARDAEINRYRVAAAAHQTTASTCEQKLAGIDKALRDEARARAKEKAPK